MPHLPRVFLVSLSIASVAPAEIDYARDVRPILSDKCYNCHGPDANARKAKLRLDKRDAALGSAIVPGQLNKSELIQRILAPDPEDRMPPPDKGVRLSKKEKDMLFCYQIPS